MTFHAPKADVAATRPDVRRLLVRSVLAPSWAAIGAVLLLVPFSSGLPPWALFGPFVGSLVLLGLPHGALDHLTLLRLGGRPLRPKPLLGVLALYLVLALAYLAAWFALPAAAFAFFIALTWFHWGQGDLHALLVLLRAGHLRTRPQRALAVFVRGGLPMLVPLLAFPDVYAEVAGLLISRIDAEALSEIGWAFRADVRLGVGVAYGAAVVVHLVVGFRTSNQDGRPAWWTDVGETLGLAAFFGLVHPVLAVGLYFCLWHATRHIARLMLHEDRMPEALAARRLGLAWRRFALHALPATAGALLMLGGLYALVPAPPQSVGDFVGLYLILIAALTLPHVVVVGLMDRDEGVWRPAGRPPT